MKKAGDKVEGKIFKVVGGGGKSPVSVVVETADGLIKAQARGLLALLSRVGKGVSVKIGNLPDDNQVVRVDHLHAALAGLDQAADAGNDPLVQEQLERAARSWFGLSSALHRLSDLGHLSEGKGESDWTDESGMSEAEFARSRLADLHDLLDLGTVLDRYRPRKG